MAIIFVCWDLFQDIFFNCQGDKVLNNSIYLNYGLDKGGRGGRVRDQF